MIILDEPYASVPLLDWMEASAHPVLANGFTEKLVAGGRTLNLVDADECARRLEAGERIYTNSENALAWILDHVDNPTLTDAIRLFKDKAAMREKLAPLSPGLFHKTVDRAGLEAVNVADLPLPVVLKPAVGFCSMGVYVIEEPEDWALSGKRRRRQRIPYRRLPRWYGIRPGRLLRRGWRAPYPEHLASRFRRARGDLRQDVSHRRHHCGCVE